MWVLGMSKAPSVARLLRVVDRGSGSAHSRRTYRNRVLAFARWSGMGVEELLAGFRDGDMVFRGVFDEYLDMRLAKGISRHSLEGEFTAVKKWLGANGIPVDLKFREFGVKVFSVVEDRRPTKQELRILMDWGSPRMQMALTFLASSGVRTGAFVQLTMRHLDLDYHGVGKVSVPAPLNKNRTPYTTFITPEAVAKTRFWLDYREREGETLGLDTPLFGVYRGRPAGYLALRGAYNRLLAKAGFEERSHGWRVLHLHTLRKFFRTETEMGGVPTPMIDMMMGHRGRGLDPSYWRPREQDVLKAYVSAVPYLTITESEELRDALERRETEMSLKMMEREKEGLKMRDQIDRLVSRIEALERRRKD